MPMIAHARGFSVFVHVTPTPCLALALGHLIGI